MQRAIQDVLIYQGENPLTVTMMAMSQAEEVTTQTIEKRKENYSRKAFQNVCNLNCEL